MATPNKKRGFRAITVNNELFNWCFQGIIDIRPNNNKNNQLLIDFGYYDGFDYVNEPKENRPPPFEPKIVTPKFVSQSIENALKLGWDIELNTGRTVVEYRNKEYTLIKNAIQQKL